VSRACFGPSTMSPQQMTHVSRLRGIPPHVVTLSLVSPALLPNIELYTSSEDMVGDDAADVTFKLSGAAAVLEGGNAIGCDVGGEGEGSACGRGDAGVGDETGTLRDELAEAAVLGAAVVMHSSGEG